MLCANLLLLQKRKRVIYQPSTHVDFSFHFRSSTQQQNGRSNNSASKADKKLTVKQIITLIMKHNYLFYFVPSTPSSSLYLSLRWEIPSHQSLCPAGRKQESPVSDWDITSIRQSSRRTGGQKAAENELRYCEFSSERRRGRQREDVFSFCSSGCASSQQLLAVASHSMQMGPPQFCLLLYSHITSAEAGWPW